jgi:hypothetical protein
MDELKSVIAYLDDEIQRDENRLKGMADGLKYIRSVSLQKRIVNGKIYYYKKYRDRGKVIAKYLGNEKNIDYQKEKSSLEKENQELIKKKEMYAALKSNYIKMKRVLNYVKRIVSE